MSTSQMQEYLNRTVKAARAESFANSDQLSLGNIIEKCRRIKESLEPDKERKVMFDFEYLRPVEFDSWRGIYAELALSFSEEGEISLDAFLDMAISALGNTFTGYKGGEFTMTESTPIWVANYGNSGNTAVIDVVDDGYYAVILMTGYRET